MRISDWSSDVCSSDLEILVIDDRVPHGAAAARHLPFARVGPGRIALCRKDGVARGMVGPLVGVGRGIEAPALLAGVGVVGGDIAAPPELRPAVATERQSVAEGKEVEVRVGYGGRR